MDDQTIHEVRQWLIKADHDLRSAERLMSGNDPLLDTAVYHCQQAAEKALKAFLTSHEVIFSKTHLLVTLVAQCTDIDPDFINLSDAAEMLTPLATEFRYPGDVMEPEMFDAQEAFRMASDVLKFVSARISIPHAEARSYAEKGTNKEF